MRKAIFLAGIVFFSFYTWFWVAVFNKQPSNRAIEDFLIKKKILSQQSIRTVLKQSVQGDSTVTIPSSYVLSVMPRKQVFNLSCEFAAATAIIHHYTNDEFFSPKNELAAEKMLIAKIPASLNPNIGIRMGIDATESAEAVLANIKNRFGGTEYYGVHAPPFIDLFWEYKLLARPIKKGDLEAVKKAVFSGHLVMTWISIGYERAVDVALSYGTTPVVKGEHAVVIYGYNQDGVFVMDPGIGTNRFLSYQTILDATSLFPLPFLEVNPSIKEFPYEPTERVDALTGLDRAKIKIAVQNASGEVGAGSAMSAILKDFGYAVVSMEQITSEEREGVSILLKKELADYAKLIRQDISLAGYQISSFFATQTFDSSTDAVVVVGE
ncbi:MAG: C39 family peptidase [Candidatus Levybacteria bacterium]|nr:C39 family peptidase [Candidatus Levybacteria bacterium]